MKLRSLKILYASVALVLSTMAHAEDVNQEKIPDEFFYEYLPGYEIVLEYDLCDKSDVTQGWKAHVTDYNINETANGCWTYGNDNTAMISIDKGNHKYLDYQFFTSKFKPRYLDK